MNNNLTMQYLEAIGVPIWQLKSASEYNFFDSEPEPSVNREPSAAHEEPSTENHSDKNQIKSNSEVPLFKLQETQDQSPDIPGIAQDIVQSIQDCRLCTSRTNRLNALVGEGTTHASVVIITDAPTAEEDRSGHYLTGQLQSLFQTMFATIDLNESYFLTGIIKCFSLNQYTVNEQEVQNCSSYLNAQVEQIQPTVLVVFGVAASQMILQTKQSFNQLRGKIHTTTINNKKYSVVVSYHPAYLLRNPLYKREALSDLIMIKNLLNN
jgi:uracil-DNA glycosylase